MSGIKGQKWSANKLATKKHKCNFQLEHKEYSLIEKFAKEKEWSISKSILYFVKKGLIV